MGPRTTRALAVLGAATILVIGVNAVTYAATGQSLLLGKSNYANRTTVVKNTGSGAALSVLTKSSATPPFTTNGKGRVVNLNADKVDGLDAAQLAAVKAIRYKDASTSRSGDTTYTIGKVPKGTYLVSFNAVVSLTTSGSNGAPQTMACYLWQNIALFNAPTYAENSSVSVGQYYVSPSFNNVLTFNGTEKLLLSCGTTTGDGWNTGIFGGGQPPTLTFTRLDGVTNKAAAP